MEDPADDGAPHGAHGEDWDVGLGDDGIGQADEDGDGNPRSPAEPARLDQSKANSDRDSVGEGGRESRALVGKRHGQHDSHRHKTEDDSAQESKMRRRHGGTGYRVERQPGRFHLGTESHIYSRVAPKKKRLESPEGSN